MKRQLLLFTMTLAAMMMSQGVWATEDLTADVQYTLTTVGDGTVTSGTFDTYGIDKVAETAWTLTGTAPYITINLNEPLKAGDIIEISGVSSESSKYFRFYNSTTFGSTYAGAEIAIGKTEGVKQVVVAEPATATNTLIGKTTIYMNYSSSSASGTINYINVYNGTPEVVNATKSWDFTQYTVNATATTYNMVHDQILFGKGVGVISMADYKATTEASASTCILLNIPGNSGNLENGKYIMFRVPAGKTTVSMDIVTNGTSGNKSLMYKIGNEDAVTTSMSNTKYPVNKTFDVYASEVTPVYIYVGGTSNTFYFKNLSLMIIPAPTVTLDNYGYATFANSYPLDLANMSATTAPTAYKASVSGTTVNFTPVDEAVAANTGILLQGGAGETVTIPIAASGTDISATNDFKVNTAGAIMPSADITNNYFFGMLKNQSTLTFATFDPTALAIPANKAYLEVAKSNFGAGARELSFSFGDGNTTPISTIANSQQPIAKCYYDLQGRRVAQPTKGLYIVRSAEGRLQGKNGKKVVIK